MLEDDRGFELDQEGGSRPPRRRLHSNEQTAHATA
jgi:hypothetical protein